MHVGLLIHGSLDRLTGGTLYDRKLVESLRAQGDQVTVVSLPERSYLASLADNASAALATRINRAGFDVLLQDEVIHPSVFRLNRRLDVPIVAIVHLLRISQHWPWWQRPIYRAIEKRYFESVDGLVCVNPSIRERIRNLIGDLPPTVIASPAGDHSTADIDDETIHRRAHEGPLRLLFVGNLSPLKNLHLVIEALGRMSSDDWQLDVYGSAVGAYGRRIKRRITQLGLNDRITLHGQVPQPVVLQALRNGHVLVMPSDPESYSIAYLEAMSWGLPVIAHRASDSAALITPGENGYRVDNPDALAEHIMRLGRDRDQLSDMSIAARAFFTRHATWAASMGRVRVFLLESWA
ncbi:MAG: glycosyltransferase family 4 protein [Acidobacteriota bacterium]